MSNLKQIAEVLKKSSRVLLCGHVFPDGDCLGSVAALGMVLEKMGKKVTMASPDPIPENLLFLPGADRFSIGCPHQADYDTFVVLDCSEPARLGDFSSYLNENLQVVYIDHHLNEIDFDCHSYLDSKAAATGEILIDLIDLLDVSIDRDVAICLYVAIVTDSGSFRYENTSSDTLRRAARLMDIGIPASLINTNIYEEKPLETVQVLGAALNKLQISECGKVAWVIVERELLDRFAAGDEHTEGLVNFIRTIKGVEVSILIREIDQERYKVSFRSKGGVDVNKLASKWGGGGHARASGCVVQGVLQSIADTIVTETLTSTSSL